jgi:murein DD-endopeptidase MepM/ murein hydrolase activator NlpD
MRWKILLGVIVFASCSVSHDPMRNDVRRLQKGIIKDDSSYVYGLPYKAGKKYWLVQGYFSRFSHKERVALDFKMKRGTKIYAARAGIVIRVKEDGDKGGWNKKYRPFGNNIVIQHMDSSRAGYWHLQKDGALVNVGDTVKQGQLIALSGRTGYALFPHLHFIVWDFDKNGKWHQVPTRFQTASGIKYLKPIRKYKKPKEY